MTVRDHRAQLDSANAGETRLLPTLAVVDDTTFAVVDELVAPSPEHGGAHVVDHEIQKMLSLGWQRYVALVREVAGDANPALVRQITTSFEGECREGDLLVRGVRAVHRTHRSYVLEERLWDAATERSVAVSRVVMASLDPTTGKAAPVPEALWNAIEQLEGRKLETMTTRPSST